MQYCLAINTKKSEESLCEAIDSILGRSPKQFCSQIKAINKYYIRLADNVIQLGTIQYVIIQQQQSFIYLLMDCNFINYF